MRGSGRVTSRYGMIRGMGRMRFRRIPGDETNGPAPMLEPGRGRPYQGSPELQRAGQQEPKSMQVSQSVRQPCVWQ